MVNTVFTVISVSKQFCPRLQKRVSSNLTLRHDFIPGLGGCSFAGPTLHTLWEKIIPWAFLHLENQALKQGSLPNSAAECTMNESRVALLGEAQVAQCCPKTKSCLRDTFCRSDFPEEQAGAGVKPAARNLSYLFSFNFPPLSTQHLHD